MRRRLLACLLATAAGVAATAPAAFADAGVSTNWAGYAVHGASFAGVSGSWVEPRPACTRGHAGYSAAWVGLGGFSAASNALEQIGTEEDCSSRGTVVSSAWYELVPAPSVTIPFPVVPGDRMAAAVRVSGGQAQLSLVDQTSGRTFSQSLPVSHPDLSSAEWILEAPSSCDAVGCEILPLDDFHSVHFIGAQAQGAGGHSGTILDAAWQSTRISLRPSASAARVRHGQRNLPGAAVASTLAAHGSAFSVSYVSGTLAGAVFARRLRLATQAALRVRASAAAPSATR